MRKYSKILVLLIILFSTVAFAASQQTSSTTAQTVINNSKALLNGSDDDIFSDTEMLVWLNNGQVDIVSRSHCLQTTADISLVASTIEYTISDSYLMVDTVIYTDASSVKKGLIQKAPQDIGRQGEDWSTSPNPAYWYEWNGKVGIFPALASVTTETVTLYLVTRPTAITISDNITIPAVYDKALTYYVTAQALWKDRQTGRYAQMMQMYLNEISLYRVDLNETKSNE